jgi:hypothetical protein
MKAFANPETLSLDTSILLTQNHIILYAGYCADFFSDIVNTHLLGHVPESSDWF